MYTVFVCAVFLVVFLLAIENYRETHHFVVVHYNVSSHKLQEAMSPQTVLVLSDLHNNVYGTDNQELLDKIEEQHPDLILVAGDMIVGHTGYSFHATAEFICKLTQFCPVYYGNGNHEQRMKEYTNIYGDRYKQYTDILKKAGVNILENASKTIFLEGNRASVCGIEIPMEYYKKFQHDFLELEEMKQLVGDPISHGYQILIAHNPVHYKTYEAWGADLIVSGHLHGGIIRLPVLGGVITPQVQLFPPHSGGIYRNGETTHVVSKGLGDHTVRIRLFNPAEIVVLHVKGTK